MTAPDEVAIVLGAAPRADTFSLVVELDGVEATATIPADGPGVFRLRRRAGDEPIAGPGRYAQRGEVVGFLQRGPLLTPVNMPSDGWLVATIPDLARVGHGDALIRILLATGAITP